MSDTPPKKKNILLILVDQERMPMHFPDGIALPAHEWLRKRGVSFTNYHVNTAPCTPSRSVIFTGWHTLRNGMVDNLDFSYVDSLNPEIATLGSMAAKAGYYCAYKGKWHLTRDDRAGKGETFLEPYEFHDYQHEGDLHSTAREGHTHDGRIVSDALYWLHDWVNYRTEESSVQPFFLVCGLVNPHDVMTVKVSEAQVQHPEQNLPAESKDFFMEIMTPPNHALYETQHAVELCESWSEDGVRESRDDKPAAHWEAHRVNNYSFGTIPPVEQPWKDLVNYYINCQRDVDREVMRLFQYLEETGLDQDTIVVFTADHGEMAGAHGLRNKGPYIYKENNNVPLIICHPDGRQGVRCEALGSTLDLAPTLIGLWDGDPADFPDLYGHNFSEAVFDRSFAGPREELGLLFTYTSLCTLDADYVSGETPVPDLGKRGLLFGIRTVTHKFARYFAPTVRDPMPTTIDELRSGDFDLELYDLQSDPEEITNLANDPKNNALIVELNNQLNALINVELQGVDLIPRGSLLPEDVASFRSRYG